MIFFATTTSLPFASLGLDHLSWFAVSAAVAVCVLWRMFPSPPPHYDDDAGLGSREVLGSKRKHLVLLRAGQSWEGQSDLWAGASSHSDAGERKQAGVTLFSARPAQTRSAPCSDRIPTAITNTPRYCHPPHTRRECHDRCGSLRAIATKQSPAKKQKRPLPPPPTKARDILCSIRDFPLACSFPSFIHHPS